MEGNRLVAPGVSYPVVGGIPDFLAAGDVVGELDVHTDYVIARRPYEGLARRTHGPIVQELERAYLQRATRALGRGLDVLDVGCGSSKFRPGHGLGPKPSIQIFLEHARSYTGIDPSWAMLKAASQSDSLTRLLPQALLVRAIGEALPFPNSAFDLVFVKSTLDHCADAPRALSEFRRVLRPDGFVLITLQNFSSWQRRTIARLMPERYRKHRLRDHHTSPFDPILLRTRLHQAGFRIDELREMGYLHLSRYKLGWIENALLAVPHLATRERGVEACVRAIDHSLGRVAPGFGATMTCWASKVNVAPPVAAAAEREPDTARAIEDAGR